MVVMWIIFNAFHIFKDGARVNVRSLVRRLDFLLSPVTLAMLAREPLIRTQIISHRC